MNNNKANQKKSTPIINFYLFLRLILTGISLGVIFGTSLKIFSEAYKNDINNFRIRNSDKLQKNKNILSKKIISSNKSNTKKEIKSLSDEWEYLSNNQKGIQATAFLLFLDDGRFAKLFPNKPMPAASSIKTPILLAALKKIDLGQLFWNEPIKLKKELIGGGAGWMAYQQLGRFFPTHEVATEMIRVSDNTATNLIINKIGGIKELNNIFRAWGLEQTVVRNLLPDLEGTNTTSAKDLVTTIELVESGNELNSKTRDLFREVLSTSKTNSLLPGGLLKGLGGTKGDTDYKLLIKGYRVFNKTGDIGTAYVDAGLIELPDMRKAIAAFMVTGPFNDPRSTELIRDMAASMASVLRPKPFQRQENK